MTNEPTDPERPADPELFTRWLTIEHLLDSARGLEARGVGAWPSLALVSADAATEAMLGLVAAGGANPPGDRAKWDEIYEAALVEFRERGSDLSSSIRTRIRSSHRARNAAIHDGTGPAAPTVEAAIKVAVELRGLIVNGLAGLRPFDGGGPVGAIAVIVGIQPISGHLAEAERHLREGRTSEAADSAAIALELTLRRVQPPLRSAHPRILFARSFRGLFKGSPSRGAFGSPFSDAERHLDDMFGNLDDRVAHHEAWILAAGVGMRPAELLELQRVLGRPYGLDGQLQVNRGDVALSSELVQSCLLQTADLIYRVWQGGSLGSGRGALSEPP